MDSSVEVQGKHLKLSNLEKVLYPATGFTKQQVIDYYVRIAPAMVPHLAGRPLTRKRYPNGVDEEFFYEKNYEATPLLSPDFAKLAEAYGIRSIVVKSRDEVVPAVRAAKEHGGSVVIDFQVAREENVFPFVPPGEPLTKMVGG